MRFLVQCWLSGVTSLAFLGALHAQSPLDIQPAQPTTAPASLGTLGPQMARIVWDQQPRQSVAATAAVAEVGPSQNEGAPPQEQLAYLGHQIDMLQQARAATAAV